MDSLISSIVAPAYAQYIGGAGGGQQVSQEQDFCEKYNVSPCTPENISAKQVELFCEQYNVSPCTRENALAKAQELGLAPQSGYVQGMKMTTSGKSVDVVLEITYGRTTKDLLSGSLRQHVDYTVTFYKPGTSEIMPNVHYALVDYSNEPKAECPSTNDLCRTRIPGMFGGSNIGITVTDNGRTLDTMNSQYHGLQQGSMVEITQSGGQTYHDVSEFEAGSNTIEVIVGVIDGKQIPQESAKFNISVTPEFPVQTVLLIVPAVLIGMIVIISRTSKMSLKP